MPRDKYSPERMRIHPSKLSSCIFLSTLRFLNDAAFTLSTKNL